MADWDRDYVLDKLSKFHRSGQNELDSWESDRIDAEYIWNGEFRNDPEENSLYFPKVYQLLRHHVRAGVKTYSQTAEILSVSPIGMHSTDYENHIAKKQQEELGYHLRRWNDMTTFHDDSWTQGEKDGCMVSYVRWIRETKTEDIMQTSFEINENGETVPVEEKVGEEEIVTKNHVRVENVDINSILWDPSAKVWRDVRWVMLQHIEESEDELYALVDQGFDLDEIEDFIGFAKREEKSDQPDEDFKYERVEFWGLMKPSAEDTEALWVKCSADKDYKYLLQKPTEDVYRDPMGNPVNPFTVGYLIRKEGEIVGESNVLRGKRYQSEINCIRDQRRRAIENDLNERYIVDKNSDVEFEEMDGGLLGSLIKSDGTDGVKEIRHWDNTQGSYAELATTEGDLQEMYGVNAAVLGLPDPHLPDTAYGMNLMSNAANTVIFDNIVHYNNTYLEPTLQKVLYLSMQYLTPEELEGDGIDMANIPREEMQQQELRIVVDTGHGATSEQVKLNNLTRAFFIIQQAVQFGAQTGIETGELAFEAFDTLDKMLPLLNVRDAKIPNAEEMKALTLQAAQFAQQQQQQALQNAMGQAGMAGQEAGQGAITQLAEQAVQPTPEAGGVR